MQWFFLEKLWSRSLNSKQQEDTSTWNQELEVLYQLGISMEETLQYLYFHKPDFPAFQNWILQNKEEIINSDLEKREEVLSGEDLEFWDENGYVVIKNAVSAEDCRAAQDAIYDFLNMDPNNKGTWYKRHPEQKGVMVNFSNHPALNKNRASLRIQKAYEQLYNSTRIYKTIDKISFNPPECENFKFLGSKLHWDVSLKLPIPFAMQGLLYLTDCKENEGAFHCVPGFHNKIEHWMKELQTADNPRAVAERTLKPKAITGNAGDFIIWHQGLPHCATPNRGSTPRLVQYLTYRPENYTENPEWI
jgi:hypothetical protein